MSPGRTSRPSNRDSYSSIRPSGVPNIELPFGPAGETLSAIQSDGPISTDLRRRIRALSNNANRVQGKSPLLAAQCWHEAGRLLDRQVKRHAEAWVCYSRALALYPDLKVAISALLRLARVSGDNSVTHRLIEAALARTNDVNEQTALLCEAATLLIKAGNLQGAYSKLAEARRIHPTARVPKLLLTLITGSIDVPEQRAPIISDLADDFGPSRISDGLRKASSQVMLTESRESIPPGDGFQSDLPAAWIHLRYCLEMGKRVGAMRVLSRMIAEVREPALKKTLIRLRSTLSMLEGIPAAAWTDQMVPDPMHSLLCAVSGETINRDQALTALKDAGLGIRSAPLGAGFSILENLIGIRTNEHNVYPKNDPSLPPALVNASQSFVKMASTNVTQSTKMAAAALHRALSQRSWSQAATQLLSFWKKTSDEAIRWPLMVARTAVQIEHLGSSSSHAQKVILEKTDTPFLSPLPTIMRKLTNNHQELADIAMREADAAPEITLKASRLAWAAYHMETIDPFEAARRYSKALSLDPTLRFAIAGLRRTGTFDEELVRLLQNAIDECETASSRALLQCHAAVALYRLGRLDDAGKLMCEAALTLEEERALGYAGLSISLSRPFPPQAALTLLNHSTAWKMPALIAPLALFSSPLISMEEYKTAAVQDPADPIVDMGFIEAHLMAERPASVSEKYLTMLRTMAAPEKVAGIYQRLAHIDRFSVKDPFAAVLSAHSLSELMPGHRPTLVQMAVYYLSKHRRSDLRRVLTLLALSVEDELDATALARLAALHDPSHVDLLRYLVKNNQATLLEIIALEGRATETDEQRALLEEISHRLPDQQVFQSRMADLLGRTSEHEAAIALFKRSMENQLLIIYNLIAMTGQLRTMGNHKLLVDTLAVQSDYYSQAKLKAEILVAAALLTRDNLKDPSRAVALCMLALSHDPNYTEAFEIGEKILNEIIDDPMDYIALLETRLKGDMPPLERLVLHLKLKDLFSCFDDRAAVEKRILHEEAAVAIIINENPGFDDTLLAEEQKIQAEVWLDAVDDAIEHKRLPHAPEDDVALWAAVGDNMITFMENDVRAEHYFDKALNLDDQNITALKFMAELRLKSDNVEEAASLYTTLFNALTDPVKKREIALKLSDIFFDILEDETRAEAYLTAASTLDPSDLQPLRQLIEMYTKEGDDFTMSIHLDSALARHCLAVSQTPQNSVLYDNLLEITTLQKDAFLSSLAEDLTGIVHAQESSPKATWSFDPLVGDPGSDPYMCPSVVTHALRATIGAMTAPITTFINVESELTSARKLKKRAPLQARFTKMASLFNLKDVACRVGPPPTIKIISGPPSTVIFPERFQDAPQLVQDYAVAYALELFHLSLGIVTLISGKRLMAILAGLIRVFDDDYRYPDLDETDMQMYSRDVTRFTPKEVIESLTPHIRTIQAALQEPDLPAKLIAPGHRAGFFAATTIRDALNGLLYVTNHLDSPLLEAPDVGLLLSFVFSRDHRMLRERFGS